MSKQQCHRNDEHCITCSDEAWPGRILTIDSEAGLAIVQAEQADEEAEVDITLLDQIEPGTQVLVHGGVAISTLEDVLE
ncbi:HypC/HybG/HupF family hydrogenase formation chaperone [Tengunoibacter tsumagoiensis]|uniref:Hydrogenase assembly protein HupF n=1 Tax=Tengunoibacter tsumagoiensis TaxID=2014871 RepID=A0A402A163_9CHLR|nr:HypC/HybG/HupF family hydrogenase formation chaperone [Tengunoibacter tsumagoiensis]GCE12796.1 hypothetical protein KTT_26550 [Tengunoibacter tsumagoiensis]